MTINLEQQVTSLELSKRLKELGVKQESIFYWQNYRQLSKDEDWVLYYDGDFGLVSNARVSAFTVAELGEMCGKIQCERYENSGWSVHWISSPMNEYSKTYLTRGDTLTEALGLMLAYLIENKLMSV